MSSPREMVRRAEAIALARAVAAAEDIGDDGQNKMVNAAPVETGHLRSRISHTVTSTPSSVKVSWLADTPYAAAQDQGWIVKDGKYVRFSRHPRGGGAGYMSHTVRDNAPFWMAEMQRQVGGS